MTTTNEEALLVETAQIGRAYASQLIEWFGTASAAIDYLCAAPHDQARLLDAALHDKRTP